MALVDFADARCLCPNRRRHQVTKLDLLVFTVRHLWNWGRLTATKNKSCDMIDDFSILYSGAISDDIEVAMQNRPR